jgi:hypothetical protein
MFLTFFYIQLRVWHETVTLIVWPNSKFSVLSAYLKNIERRCGLAEVVLHVRNVRGCIQKFPDWNDNEIDTRWEATQSVTAAKLTRLTHKIATRLHLVAESCTIRNSSSRRPVRKLLDTLSYLSTYLISSGDWLCWVNLNFLAWFS